MTKLASLLASRKLSVTAKAYILLDAAGGKSTTGELISLGRANGARDVNTWNLAAIFGRNRERVARLEDGWQLLEQGIEYLRLQGQDPQSLESQQKPGEGQVTKSAIAQIVIGHGRSPLWKELKEWLRDNYECKVHEFNSQSVAGTTNKERLEELMSVADIAFVLMTAEDEMADGAVQARMNDIHEVGLFQGRLGFTNAPVLLEDGCQEFSNIAGIGQIRFPAGDLGPGLVKVRQYLRDRHGLQ